MSTGGAREGGGGGAQDGCSSEDAISFFFENRGLAATLLHIAGLLGFAFGQRRSVLCCAASGCPQLFCFHVSAPPVVTLAFQTPGGRVAPRCQTRGNGTVAEGSFLAGGRDNLVRDFNWVGFRPLLQIVGPACAHTRTSRRMKVRVHAHTPSHCRMNVC
eukprot:Tamp_03875.p2 GENE.Tamp_03875~~Tamp_03875.p2  ORF type:complete len:159 (+),score=17.23 Tamp_03875:1105-1581(+)